MKKIFIGIALLGLLAAGCNKTELKRDTPYSPPESYNQLPQ